MEPYKDPWLSLVRYVKGIAAEALSQNLVPTLPAFVNLDAHAQVNSLPLTDFLSIASFSLHMDDQFLSIYCQIGVSTYNDTDNLRHIDLMNLVLKSFLSMTIIPIYSNGDLTTVAVNMACTGSPMVDPTRHDDVRSLQFLTVKLLPVTSVSASPN